MGSNTVRRRRVSLTASNEEAPTKTTTLVSDQRGSSHALFFGTDDVATLKKTDDTSAKDDVEEVPIKKEERTKEVQELFDLARDVFHVYFSDSDNADTSKSKQKKKSNVFKKINGTMPGLPSYLAKLQFPAPIVTMILFAEASFRGIAQVRRCPFVWN